MPVHRPASSATSAFEDAKLHSDEAPAAIDPFSARAIHSAHGCGFPCDPSAPFHNGAGQMQRVPVYRLTFASIPMVAFDQRTMSCRYTRWWANRTAMTSPAKPETVFWGKDMPGRSGHRKGNDSRSETAATFLPSHRGDRCSTPRLKGLRHPPNPSAGPASPQRLAVYPRAEREQCAGDSRAIEKVAAGIWVFFAGFWVRY